MTTVATATGHRSTRPTLGRTLVHEHVFVLSAELRQNYPAGWDEDERVEDAVAKLNELKSPRHRHDRGPDGDRPRPLPAAHRSASPPAPSSTSSWPPASTPTTSCRSSSDYAARPADRRAPSRSPRCSSATSPRASPTPACEAAFLKCAIEHQGLTPGVERVMRAVAQAAVQTGAPITVHTDALTAVRAGRGAGARARRASTSPGGHRPRRRLERRRLPERAGRGRLVSRHGSLRSRPARTVRAARRHRRRTRPPRLRRPDGAVARRGVLHRLVPGRIGVAFSRAGTTATSARTCCPPCASAASPTPTSTRCWSRTRAATSVDQVCARNGRSRAAERPRRAQT